MEDFDLQTADYVFAVLVVGTPRTAVEEGPLEVVLRLETSFACPASLREVEGVCDLAEGPGRSWVHV
jgi:hypothetical protein